MSKTQWNGEPCKARRVLIVVGAAAKSTYWYASIVGKTIRAVEVAYNGEVFYLADEDGNGWHKVAIEGGGPHWGHKSVPCAELVRERTKEELDDRDCYCK